MPFRRLAAAAGAVVVLVCSQATPASAHAVLLRTDPSPQTTVAVQPAALRLVFSEPVEPVFGAVRLFNAGGERIRTGEAQHPETTRREVLVPVPTIGRGTYTVTWRVVSDDGHAVRGGFAFHVGAPSTVPAAAVTAEGSAGALVGWGGGAARLAWYLALAMVVGSVVVRRWVWTPAANACGLPEVARDFRRRFSHLLPGAWLLLAASGAASLLFQAAEVGGLSLLDALDPSVLGEAVGTSFGRLWAAEMAVTALLLAPVVLLARRRMPPWLSPGAWTALGAGGVLGLIVLGALGGHARTDPNPVWAVASVAVHLAAVSAWVGGLLVLVVGGAPAALTAPADRRPALLAQVLRRFSPFAIGAVIAVVVTGVVNAVLGFDAVSDLWRVPHGRTVLAKVVALGLALAVAARHLLVIPRRLRSGNGGDAAPVRSFGRSSKAEMALLGVALALAAGLVDLVPGRSLAEAAKGPVSQERRAAGYTVQLFIDPTQAGENDVHVSFVNATGLTAAEVETVEVALVQGRDEPGPLRMQLLSPGHFVGQATFAVPGPYRLDVRSPGPAGPVDATFEFRLTDALFKERTP